jgi:hypothetical protein
MVDTFAAVLREFFRRCDEQDKGSEIVAHTGKAPSKRSTSGFQTFVWRPEVPAAYAPFLSNPQCL